LRLIGLLNTKQLEVKPVTSTDVALDVKNSSGTSTLQFSGEGKLLTTLDINNQNLSNAILVSPKIDKITDSNGNEEIIFSTTALAVNEITITNAATTNAPTISATGEDVNISLDLIPKGTGVVKAGGVEVVTLSGSQTLTNKTLTTPTINSFVNAGHNHTDAANGGQITDAALSTAVGVTKGGTGLTTATTAYGVICAGTTATGAFQVLNSLGTAGQVLTSNGAGVLPSWSNAAAGTVTSIAAGNGMDFATITSSGSVTLGTPSSVDSSSTNSASGTTHTHALGIVSEAKGGTNQTTYAAGDLLYASATNTLAKLPISTDGKVLTLVSGLPAWADSAGDITAVVAGDGLFGGGTSGSVQLDIELSTTSGLSLVGTSPAKTLELADSVAGDGLSITNKVISLDLTTNGGLLLTGSSPTKTIGVDFGTGATQVATGDHNHDSTYVKLSGSTMTGNLVMGANKVTSSATPSSANDLVNKTYVDSLITGLTWKNPVVTISLVGNATVATINGLSAVAGDAYVVTDSGTLTRGSVSVSAGDLVEDNGTNWVKIESNSGGFVPTGVRAILSKTTALISPYTEATDDGKIVSFNGSSNTGVDTGDAVDYSAVLVQNSLHNSYWENNGFTFKGTVPTGTWVQFTGTASINAGTGLTKSGNTLNVLLGAGIKELPTDEIGIDLSAISGLELTSQLTGGTLQIADTLAGDGLTINSKVLAVGAGTGISVTADAVSINQAANLTWTGNHTFNTGIVNIGTATLQLGGTSVTAAATEINQALDGISANVTATNLNTLTASSSSDAQSLHTHANLAKQYTDGGFTGQTSVTVTHNLAKYPVVNVLDSSGYVIIPNNIQHTSINAFTVTFAEATTGTIVYVA